MQIPSKLVFQNSIVAYDAFIFIISMISRLQTYIALSYLKAAVQELQVSPVYFSTKTTRFQSGFLLSVHPVAAVRGNPSTDDVFKFKLFSVPFF